MFQILLINNNVCVFYLYLIRICILSQTKIAYFGSRQDALEFFNNKY